jgi:ankyrin repeat protein
MCIRCRGANPNLSDELYGNTPLNSAVTSYLQSTTSSIINIMTILIDSGANIHQKHIGQTALHSCANHGRVEPAMLLLDVDVIDDEGYSPLRLAIQENHLWSISSWKGEPTSA